MQWLTHLSSDATQHSEVQSGQGMRSSFDRIIMVSEIQFVNHQMHLDALPTDDSCVSCKAVMIAHARLLTAWSLPGKTLSMDRPKGRGLGNFSETFARRIRTG